ncbi:MAG: hypothetical protein FVQ84_03250 [Planctomycetes bacterium]|nr:hypothetical protein [Planctomycetota bacterium]
MKKTILLTALFLLALGDAVRAEEGELGVTLNFKYMSKWLSKGAYGYGQQGAFFKIIDLDLYGTGYGVKVAHRNATASGYVDKQRFDYRPYYKSTLFEGEPYTTNYSISCGYEHYTGLARNVANTTFEWIFEFSMPNIIPEGIVPKYKAHYEYPAGSGYTHDDITGWVHRFGLVYDLDIIELPKALHISGEIAYHDGLGGQSTDHDWSYAAFGLSTNFDLTENLTFAPGIYYQITMDKSINPDKDVTYCILGMEYKF